MHTSRRILTITLALVAVLVAGAWSPGIPRAMAEDDVTPLGVLSSSGQNGTTLSATISAVGHWQRTFGWIIQKSATPAVLDLFQGDSASVAYGIALTKDEGTDAVRTDGSICVTNGGAVATEGLTIGDDVLYKVGGPFQVLLSAQVDTSAKPVLAPGESYCYAYSIPFTAVAGAQYKNSAAVTILNHSGHVGEPFGPSPDANFSLPSAPDILINNSVNVDDTFGPTSFGPFSGNASFTYDRSFACDADQGSKANVATIRETGQSDDASVQVNCYVLQVAKTAATSFTRTYKWVIGKTAATYALTLAPGESYSLNYLVSVGLAAQPYVDSAWAVSGNIRVTNPAPMAAPLNGVADVVGSGIDAPVDCGVAFPYSLPAGATLICSYASPLPDASNRVNTATATLRNSPSGTTEFDGTAAVSFAAATITEKDHCVTVTDTFAGGPQGVQVCLGVDTLPATFTYARSVSFAQCSATPQIVSNVASASGNDTGTPVSAPASVVVNVPCQGGCTLTPGYWKTHSAHGPAPYDDAWDLLNADGPFFDVGKSWYTVMWTPPAGNAYYILAHAYAAAVMNQVNGASVPPTVQAALVNAANLLNTYDGNPQPMSAITKGAVKASFVNTAAILDQYNSGLTGPGHCSE